MKAIKKSILGILLSLAMVIGLMPGMRLTTYAESYPSVAIRPTNELLS